MSAKASASPQDLPPITWRSPFLDGVDVIELQPEVGWDEWDLAVAEFDQAADRINQVEGIHARRAA